MAPALIARKHTQSIADKQTKSAPLGWPFEVVVDGGVMAFCTCAVAMVGCGVYLFWRGLGFGGGRADSNEMMCVGGLVLAALAGSGLDG